MKQIKILLTCFLNLFLWLPFAISNFIIYDFLKNNVLINIIKIIVFIIYYLDGLMNIKILYSSNESNNFKINYLYFSVIESLINFFNLSIIYIFNNNFLGIVKYSIIINLIQISYLFFNRLIQICNYGPKNIILYYPNILLMFANLFLKIYLYNQ